MFSSSNSMDDCGLSKATTPAELTKTNPSGRFNDPWGGAFDKLDKTLAVIRDRQLGKFAKQTFSRGEAVTKRGRPDINGTVVVQGDGGDKYGRDCVIDFEDGSRELVDSRELIRK
jgi:hypothetical protein